MEVKNLKSLRELLPLKKTITQFIISVSIFSLVFSCSSSTLLYYHLRNLAVNKNYIFLICNGILVFLVTTSAPPSGSDPYDLLQKRTGEPLKLETLPDKHLTLDESQVSIEDDEAQEMEQNGAAEDQEFDYSNERSDEVLISITESSDERDDAEIELQHLCCEESSDEEEEVDVVEKLSTEELNQKFEDFIRRMKEEFRVNENHQQQLVLVK